MVWCVSSFKVDLTNYLRDTFNFSGFASFGPFGFYGSDGGAEHSEDYKTGAVTTGAAATTKLLWDGPLGDGMPVFSIYGFIGLLGKGTVYPVSDYQFHFRFQKRFYMPWIVVANRISLIH